jgi:hypothetical protein
MRRPGFWLIVAAALAAMLVPASMAAARTRAAARMRAAAWTPEPVRYGVGKRSNVPVRMSDGTIIRANVFYPTDPRTGTVAAGRFPVIMVQNPYGKDTVGAASGQQGGPEAGSETGQVPYLIERGYIDVVAEVRGTGDSEGTFNLLDPVQGHDGATLVRWAARLPHADGRVGLYGPSYMGLDQYMTATALGPHSPLKALFPIVAGNDTYRDIAFDGGIADGEFDLIADTTVFGPLEEANPLAEDPTDLAELLKLERQHVPALLSYNASQTINIMTGGDEAYDQRYWQIRAPRNMLARIVADRIPAYMVDGWYDLYQRGAPLNYSGFQNAYDGRPVGAPMTPTQPVTGRYQLLQGPWYHLDAGEGVDIYRIQLAWFDRWLKGEDTGIDRTQTPLHLYQIGAGRLLDASRYPLPQAQPHTYYLRGGPSGSGAPSLNDGQLSPAAPATPLGADTIVWSGATSPCSRSTEQWGAGGAALLFELGGLPPDPCTQDDRSVQSGPGALTYTTAPFSQPTVLAGPSDVTLFARASTAQTEWVVRLEDVAPDGSSLPLTSGALLGSLRALDPAASWDAPGGRPLLPYHPYTRASERPVIPGQLTRYDIEVFPTFARLAPGHRLRVTINTADTPHLLPSPAQQAALAGGVYRVRRNALAASYLEVPLAPDSFPPAKLAGSS